MLSRSSSVAQRKAHLKICKHCLYELSPGSIGRVACLSFRLFVYPASGQGCPVTSHTTHHITNYLIKYLSNYPKTKQKILPFAQ
jgi:hypothetical protein